MENIIAKGLSLYLLQEMGLSQFNVFDIRSTQAFLSAHLQGSLHAKGENEIIEYLKGKNISKPLLIICFASKKSKILAQNIIYNRTFQSLYPFSEVYYLDCGIMEAFENGFAPICS